MRLMAIGLLLAAILVPISPASAGYHCRHAVIAKPHKPAAPRVIVKNKVIVKEVPVPKEVNADPVHFPFLFW